MKTIRIHDERISFLKILLFILLLSYYIFAQTKTFTAATDNNWNTANNWSPSGVPASSNPVIIPAGRTCTVNANASCASLTFNSGAASNLNFSTWNLTLTVSGSIIVNNATTITIGIISHLIAGGSFIVNGSAAISSTFGYFEVRNGITNNGSITTSGYVSYQFTTNNQAVSGNSISLSGVLSIGNSIVVTNNTNLTISGNLTGGNASSRFINASNASLNAGGNVMTTGLLDASSSGNAVNYSGANQTIKNVIYYHLSTSGSGTKTISNSASSLNVYGNLTIGNATTLNGNDIIINIRGNWTNNGSYTNPNSISFTGTSLQTIGGTAATAFDTLIVNNSSGLTLSANQTINDLLILTNGNINTSSSNLLTVGAAGLINGGSQTSFVNGPLSRGKNTAAQQTLFYPIGKNSSYRPIELIVTHSNTNLSNYTAEVFNTAPAARTLPGTLSRISNVRYWNVSKSGTATVTSAYITLNYGTDDGVSDPIDLRIAKANGSAWVDIGGTANGSPTGSILSLQFTTFSDFVLANANSGSNPLPVELTSFTGSARSNDVILSWSTKTEIQNYGFEIERKQKTGDWSQKAEWMKAGFIQGHGNSNSQKNYSFVDKQLNTGIYLFRLKQMDTDGNFQYSAEIEIPVGLLPDMFILEQNYPNPFNPVTNIRFAVNESGPVSVKVYDALGNEIRTLFNEPAESGRFYTIEFNGSDYSSGVYYYSINGNSLHAVKKMLLIK